MFYCVLLGFTGFYCFFPVIYWVLSSFTGFYRILLDFTGFYRVLLGFTECRRVYTESWPCFQTILGVERPIELSFVALFCFSGR